MTVRMPERYAASTFSLTPPMGILIIKDILRQAQSDSVGTYVTERGCRRLFHHVPQLPGKCQLALLAWHGRGLDEDDLTTYRRPCQPCCNTRAVDTLSSFRKETLSSQVLRELLRCHRNGRLSALCNLFRHFTTKRANLALQVTYARLACIVTSNATQYIVADYQLILL